MHSKKGDVVATVTATKCAIKKTTHAQLLNALNSLKHTLNIESVSYSIDIHLNFICIQMQNVNFYFPISIRISSLHILYTHVDFI